MFAPLTGAKLAKSLLEQIIEQRCASHLGAQQSLDRAALLADEGRSTARQIVAYSVALIPVTLAPAFMGMAGRIYLVAALAMGLALLYVGVRLASLEAPITAAVSKQRARQLLQATVFYLPLLFIVMMLDTVSS